MNGMTLTIKGLFGHFNYEIPLYGLDNSEGIPMSSGVTILTGPNGYGKTTILRILEAISKGNLEFFSNLKFTELTLRTEQEDKNLTIQKEVYGLIINDDTVTIDEIKPYMAFQIHDMPKVSLGQSDLGSSSDVVLNGDISDSNVSIHVNMSPSFEPLPLSVTSTRQVGKDISPAQAAKFTTIYSLLTESVSKAFMIREQRLIEKTSFGIRDVVSDIPHKLHFRFLEMSDQSSSKLDSSFPYRLLEQFPDSGLTKEDFDRLYQEMNRKLRILKEYELSEFEQQAMPTFHEGKTGALRIFFDYFNEKYKAYEPLINKLTLFRKILDRRFRDFKRVEISREYGLRVRDIQTDDNGDIIPLEKLSSGEQETLVLYYQLIFETEPGTLLLIDEPEISLHIEWQMTFIDELKEIVRLNNLQAVVATHSESILDANWDIQVDLGALYQDERGKLHQ